jgi:hypothetical protein
MARVGDAIGRMLTRDAEPQAVGRRFQLRRERTENLPAGPTGRSGLLSVVEEAEFLGGVLEVFGGFVDEA